MSGQCVAAIGPDSDLSVAEDAIDTQKGHEARIQTWDLLIL